MKSKMNLRSILFMAILGMVALFIVNFSSAANTAKIIVETAKLREQANVDSKVLELISLNEEVEVLKQEGDWYQVKYKKITGYLRNDLLSVNSNNNQNETTNSNTNTSSENTTNQIAENQVTEAKEENKTVETNAPTETDLTGIYQVSVDTKLKMIPLVYAPDIADLKKEDKVEVNQVVNGWAHVKKEVSQGWIPMGQIKKVEAGKTETQSATNSQEQPKQETKTMYVNAQSINVRKTANKSSEVVAQLTLNTKVTVVSQENGWSQVEVNGKNGYILSSLLSSTKIASRSSEASRTPTESKITTTNTNSKSTTAIKDNNQTTSSSTSSKGSEVVAYAQSFIGCKYVYGGMSPSGFDCSGFTSYVYKHFGISLNRTAAAQYSNGKSVSSLQPGDLVMFGKSGISHVGIYIGGNRFVHAANPGRGVTIDTLTSGYYKTNYVGARRIF